MASDVHQSDAFIAYPTNRVVGSIADPKRAQEAIEALLGVGFAREDIDILHGEDDLHRPDKSGNEGRFLSQFQRTLVHTLADEHKHLRHYIDDVRAGRSVIMVLAKRRGRRETAADILGSHGAEAVEFYGRWAWHALEPHAVVPSDDSPDPASGRTYEVHFGETTTRVRLDSESRLTILRGSASASDLSRIPVTHLRPRQLMITWQEADRTTNVHVYDFDTGEAHAVVSYANRSVHRVRGTVRRAN
jgi:molybdenum cofactor biosynthesis MoaF-like protein